MANRQLSSRISVATTLAPAVRTAAATGVAVDLAGYHAAAIEALVGTITDGTHTLTVQESDDGTTWADVATADLQGSFTALASGTVQEVGYIGGKRYIRVNAAVTGATSGGAYAVAVVRGMAQSMPA